MPYIYIYIYICVCVYVCKKTPTVSHNNMAKRTGN